mmetsp:Transcript_5250/g.16194  ORF Transcript_5250/g.16194 Transcript_5250/m.16194 type:complete len:235 (+) Transcript_5250:583-1287(+)
MVGDGLRRRCFGGLLKDSFFVDGAMSKTMSRRLSRLSFSLKVADSTMSLCPPLLPLNCLLTPCARLRSCSTTRAGSTGGPTLLGWGLLNCVSDGGLPGGGSGSLAPKELVGSEDHAEGNVCRLRLSPSLKARVPPLSPETAGLSNWSSAPPACTVCRPREEATCRGQDAVPRRFVTMCASRDFKGQVSHSSGMLAGSRHRLDMTQTSVLRKRRCTWRNVSGLSMMPRKVSKVCS